ncbi:MAG: sodium:proton antiporter [Chromatiales bacterium]|nr:MAG: sodium:proton antiporter [Chromatiales bacterium]
MEDASVIILLPSLLVLILAILTRRPIESLIAGSLVGLAMIHGTDLVSGFADTSLKVMMDATVAWIILVCGFMGSMIALLIRSGATGAFTKTLTRYIHSKKSALFFTWVLGLFMFVDDYLNSLAVGSAMRSVTDKYRTSREMLSYVVDSTAAPISVLIPLSTWVVFYAGLLVANGVAEEGHGVQVYISAIPYMLYAWVAVFLVPLVIYGFIPLTGAMKKAERRAEETGECVPPGAEHIEEANLAIRAKPGVTPRLSLFVVAMLSMVGFTLYFDLDFLKGIYASLAATCLFIIATKSLSLHDTFDTVIDGFKTMIEPLGVLVAAFILKEVNDSLGFTPYVIESIQPWLSAESLPVIIFVTMAAVSFATGSNWGVFVIVLPIVVALTNSLHADMTLMIGATLSASTFGSHACFYSDATVLTAQSSGCTPFQHAITQIPYALIAAAISAIGFVVLGYF